MVSPLWSGFRSLWIAYRVEPLTASSPGLSRRPRMLEQGARTIEVADDVGATLVVALLPPDAMDRLVRPGAGGARTGRPQGSPLQRATVSIWPLIRFATWRSDFRRAARRR